MNSTILLTIFTFCSLTATSQTDSIPESKLHFDDYGYYCDSLNKRFTGNTYQYKNDTYGTYVKRFIEEGDLKTEICIWQPNDSSFDKSVIDFNANYETEKYYRNGILTNQFIIERYLPIHPKRAPHEFFVFGSGPKVIMKMFYNPDGTLFGIESFPGTKYDSRLYYNGSKVQKVK